MSMPQIAPNFRDLSPVELRCAVDSLYAEYAAALNDFRLEEWAAMFVDDGVYKIIPRENYDRKLPLAIWLSENRAYLNDRVTAIRKTMLVAPRYMHRSITGIRVMGWINGELHAQASYTAIETLLDEGSRVFNCGRYIDRIVADGPQLKFKEKLCVFDSLVIPNSLIYPL